MKKLLIGFITAYTFLLADDESLKVVYDLTTKDVANFERKILSAIAMNKTHYEKSLKELEVTVVIHGGAYRFFTKEPTKTEYKSDKKLIEKHKELANRIKTMSETYEVEFLMCRAGMASHKLEAKDIVKFVEIIPNSTIGLIDRQNEGYAYIPVK